MRGLLARFRRQAEPPVAYDDDASMVLLLTAADAARADSEVLAEAATAGVDLTAPVLVRHHLQLPGPDEVETARRLLAQDGYRLTVTPGTGTTTSYDVRAWRTQVLTALSASQERSRMAGVAQRLGGDVTGWDALGPPVPAA